MYNFIALKDFLNYNDQQMQGLLRGSDLFWEVLYAWQWHYAWQLLRDSTKQPPTL